MGELKWWHIVIVVAIFMLLFGYKKLPSATKSIAQSLKIFKDETKGLRGDHDDEPPSSSSTGAADTTGAIAAPPVVAPPTAPSQPVQAAPEPAAVAAPGAHSLAPKPRGR